MDTYLGASTGVPAREDAQPKDGQVAGGAGQQDREEVPEAQAGEVEKKRPCLHLTHGAPASPPELLLHDEGPGKGVREVFEKPGEILEGRRGWGDNEAPCSDLLFCFSFHL